jgi:lantibiotic modifying enzyme
MSKDLMNIELELKARLYRKGVSQEIISCEVDSLLNNDIPYFYSPVCQNIIVCHSDKKINIPFKNNLFNIFSTSLNKKNLNVQMKKQVEIINIYFDAECFQRKGCNNGNII